MADPVTRRQLLARASVVAAGATVLDGRALAGAARAPRSVTPLPTPAQVRADFQTMVDFGPRLTGSAPHDRYCQWLEREFVKAGAQLLPCDVYDYERWSVGRFGLDVAGSGPVRISTYYPRSQETPAAGVTGPLVYAGVLPAPSASPDLGALQAAVSQYPDDLTTWVQGVAGSAGGSLQGAILVVDLPLPLPLTAGVFLPLAQHLHWPGHQATDWLTIDYKRTWIMPGLGVPLAPFAGLGAAGVVFICDATHESLADNYIPFDHGHEPLPALYVDRETGQALRTAAGARPSATLTLTAERKKVGVPSVTAVLPGQSEECVILNTHTDGQGFVEENGGVAFVQLARHFGSLPAAQRLKRTLVFACWPGHMSGALPELEGWMAAHPDLVDRAAAAMTIEHLGCSEWLDTADKGYHATGENETFGVWVSPGPLFEATRDALTQAGPVMGRTALLRPGVQFGVGGAFETAGVPQIGAIAGPEYLLTMKANGDMEKLDEKLAAAQIAWIADILTRIDPISAAALRAGDPALGSQRPGADDSHHVSCGPADAFVADAGGGKALAVRFYGRRRTRKGVLVKLRATGASVSGVTVELRRGDVVFARLARQRATSRSRDLVLRRRGGRPFPVGPYTLVVRRGSTAVLKRAVRLG